MKFTNILAATAIMAASATAGSAATYSLGDVSNGASTTNTLAAGTLDYYTFSIGDILGFFDIDTALSYELSGIDTEIGLYDSAGKLVDNNDDQGGVFSSLLSFGTGSGFNYGGGDSAFGQNGAIPAAGNYTLVVGAFNTTYTADIAGITTSSSQSGAYNLNFTTGGVAAVPLPAGGVLLITGLMGLAATRRKKKSA